ncbi:SHOCT domain-containing protein [Lacticaseibacillus camelliae]|uniref:SHOCT domain-containing protein n=1 Tax=Lacticaseibacillus camelliae DSM 22697 = JCM 13995 TaxID=1423730 RepID=A0A0R2F9N4_9LACO|nr:SHOCT domain-containing protein [Lacticaseibacillus camelliae]KRN24798.1 hypothetical protein FC75_GL001171 [Lacticaseibacillus camelliae DSM 22697 = JCM 13995]
MKKENKIGCGGAFILLLLFSVLITYWYVFVAIGLIGFAVWYYYHRKQTEDKAAADAQAKKDQAQAEAADRIREFKQLLDEGAITQEEFDQQKAKILGEQDDLKF